MATDSAPKRITDDQLTEIVKVLPDVDSVELKLTVPAGDTRTAGAALGLDPLDAFIRQVFFFDTPDLDLDRAGVVVRARRTQGRPDDTVVKLRPVVPADLPEKLRSEKEFNVELDALPGGYVCSASYKGKLGGSEVRETILGGGSLAALYSKGQRAFFDDHAPAGIGLDDLTVLGPVHVLKLKFSPEGYPRKIVVELWLYPDGSRIFELSTKCRPSEAFQVAAETRAFLTEAGVDLFGDQETKTRTALEFFAGSG